MAERKECKKYINCGFRKELAGCPLSCIHYKHKDEVRVVRCKDCMYYEHDKRHGTICRHPELDFDIECYDQWINTKPDDFCSYGERRTDVSITD